MQVFTTLQQIMTMLVAMQREDNTLEFKNSLTAERLFLNKYPDLKSDFQPIAMGVIQTGNIIMLNMMFMRIMMMNMMMNMSLTE